MIPLATRVIMLLLYDRHMRAEPKGNLSADPVPPPHPVPRKFQSPRLGSGSAVGPLAPELPPRGGRHFRMCAGMAHARDFLTAKHRQCVASFGANGVRLGTRNKTCCLTTPRRERASASFARWGPGQYSLRHKVPASLRGHTTPQPSPSWIVETRLMGSPTGALQHSQ